MRNRYLPFRIVDFAALCMFVVLQAMFRTVDHSVVIICKTDY